MITLCIPFPPLTSCNCGLLTRHQQDPHSLGPEDADKHAHCEHDEQGALKDHSHAAVLLGSIGLPTQGLLRACTHSDK